MKFGGAGRQTACPGLARLLKYKVRLALCRGSDRSKRRVANPPQAARLPHKGFTLLEMIVATLIMAIAVVGLLNGIAGATRNAARVREYDRVVQLARLRMNDLMANPMAPIATSSDRFNPALTGGIEAGWQAQIIPLLKPPDGAPIQVGLDRVVLQVWWMAGADNRRTFTLEGFREHFPPQPGATQ